LTEYLFLYEDLGFRKLKIGDDAIVDLTRFSMQGGQASEYRYIINKLEKLGIRFIEYEPPISDKIIKELKKVSDAWLKISRRKERKFTLGMFEYDYIRSSTIFTAEDNNNNVLAFVTLVKTYYSGETTIDIMRRRKDSPNGVMDYLFIKLFLRQQEKGFEKFNIGMAPLSGYIDEGESINIEVKTVHFIIKKLNFIFSFEGLKNFKAKYASYWIPRYVIYKNPMDLPGYVLALAKLSSVSSDELNKS